jgi:hypothetical protein
MIQAGTGKEGEHGQGGRELRAGFILPNICCHNSGLGTILHSPVQTIDLSGLTLPFQVEVQE